MSEIRHLGDITKIDGAKIDPVDVITFGSPCQDLSVAGKREGLSGERSGLFTEAIRIIKEMRNVTNGLSMRGSDDNIRLSPSTAIWENVTGAFSSGVPKGGDFRCVLEELARVKDPEISIPMPDKGKWMPSGCIKGDDWSVCWRTHDAQFWGVPQRRRRISVVARFDDTDADEILFQLLGRADDTEAQQALADTRNTSGKKIFSLLESMPRNNMEGGEQSPAITRKNGCNIADSISKMIEPDPAIAFDRAAYNQGKNAQYNFSIEEELAQTIVAKGPGGVIHAGVARRLTPTECERLQGYPDGWTDIGEWTDGEGKVHKPADCYRYKALGNSIALPFWAELAKAVVSKYEHPITLGSLFDGIGGFPLVFERAGAKAIWASEIEEFPIAVTKRRFPDGEE